MDRVGGGFARDARRRHFLRTFGENAFSVDQFHFQRQGFMQCFQMLNETIDIDAGTRRKHILWPNENVLDECRWDDAQGNFAIDAAECKVIDFVSERRNVRTLRGIDIDGKDIFPIKIEMRRQLKRKWRVPALVFAEALAVDPYGGCRHHAFEIDEDMLSARLRRELETAAVERHKLVSLLVKAVPRKGDICMRDYHSVEFAVVEFFSMAPRHELAAIAPFAIHGQNETSRR